MNILVMGAATVIIASVAFGGGYIQGKSAGKAQVQQAWDKERAQLAEEHAKNEALAREKERAMQADADKLRQEKNREIREINARATALVNSLRNRADRPATNGSVSSASEPGRTSSVCTGAELSKQDAEFLAGEAARADEIRAALQQCYKQYQSVR